MRPFVYLTLNGILGHLGFSQVFRVLEGLSSRGIPTILVSLETAQDLTDQRWVQAVEERARLAGITWYRDAYRAGGSPQSIGRNLSTLFKLGARAARLHRAGLFHARGYHAGLVGHALHLAFQRPWVFDARGYWIDERLEEGRWFTRPWVERGARRVERAMYGSAAEVVTLTQLHADDLARQGLREVTRPAHVITTCADFGSFKPRVADELELPEDMRARLVGVPVLGIIGSINRAYLPEETAQLAARVLAKTPAARVLVLSKQTAEWTRTLIAAGVREEQLIARTVHHEAMPHWMNLMSWCLMLLTPESKAKRAAMPTKLGELFASQVRVAFHGCNSEASAWVERVSNGHVLPDTTPPSLDRAAEAIARAIQEAPPASREAARAHFSLESGVRRYSDLLTRHLSGT